MSRRSLQTTNSGMGNAVLFSLERLKALEETAASILKRAVEMDNARRYLEAFTCYTEGLGVLMDIVRNSTDEVRKEKFRVRMEEYMSRAEKLKILIEREKQAGRFHEQFRIPDDGVGFSYQRLFKPLLDDEVTHIDVEDPYIRAPYQLMNFLRFCELVSQNATNLKSITLTTGKEQEANSEREAAFEALKSSLNKYSVSFIVNVSLTLHDREIRFNNGWIVKIGRGLDYFKRVPKYSLGYCDMDLRPCYETTVDIFHRGVEGGHQKDQNLQQANTKTKQVRFQ